jgi:uncharacterized protein YybS (DUF2232 family)
MQALAKFIMRGRLQAVMAMVLAAGLSMILPPLSYISGGAMVLVTLRHGVQQGLLTMVLAVVIMALLTQLGLGSAMPAMLLLAVVWLPAWSLASVLRSTISLPQTLNVAYVMGLVMVLVFYLLVGDPNEWWYNTLKESFGAVLEQAVSAQQGADSIEQFLTELSRVMTGALVSGLILNALCCLFLGRWWQAGLYNPGGFRQEFYGLRLHKSMAIFALLLIMLMIFSGSELFANLVIVTVMIYLIQGLALAHAIVSGKGWSVGLLVTMYVVLFILPQVVAFIALLGMTDAWADYRKRMALVKHDGNNTGP